MPIDTYELKEECYQEKSQSAEMLAEWQTLDLRQIPKCWAEWEMTKALEGNWCFHWFLAQAQSTKYSNLPQEGTMFKLNMQTLLFSFFYPIA